MATHSGFITKEGGSIIKNWKKRWAVLNPQAGSLSYFENEKDLSRPLGIVVVKGATIARVPKSVKGKNFAFSITSSSKVFYAFVDNEEEEKGWIDALNLASRSNVNISLPEDPTFNLFSAWIEKLDTADKLYKKKWGILNKTGLNVYKNKTVKEIEESIPLNSDSWISFPPKSKYYNSSGSSVFKSSPSSSDSSIFSSASSSSSLSKRASTAPPAGPEYLDEYLFFIEGISESGAVAKHHIKARTEAELKIWVEQIQLVTESSDASSSLTTSIASEPSSTPSEPSSASTEFSSAPAEPASAASDSPQSPPHADADANVPPVPTDLPTDLPQPSSEGED